MQYSRESCPDRKATTEEEFLLGFAYYDVVISIQDRHECTARGVSEPSITISAGSLPSSPSPSPPPPLPPATPPPPPFL